MAEQVTSSPLRYLAAVAVGAGLGGLAGMLAAPEYFWALLIGGGLMGGAVRVGAILLRDGGRQ